VQANFNLQVGITERPQKGAKRKGISAENIAVYLISFSDKVHYHQNTAGQDSAFREGRQHYTYIRIMVKQKVQLTNQLGKLLYSILLKY